MFSVVIPLFNKAPYIRRALDSVLAQTRLPDEILVIDDGSTDCGGDIVQQLGNPRIRYVRQNHQGVSVARNAGVALAVQPHVAFLDADDEWTPQFLATIVRLIECFPGAGLYGTGFVTEANGTVTGTYRVEEKQEGVVDFFKVWKTMRLFCASSIAMPVDVFRALGGFTLGVALTEDAELFFKAALAYPVAVSSEVGARYDVSVQGQAIDYWSRTRAPDFTILRHHRFLAEVFQQHVGNRSFVRFCRFEFRRAMLARLCWGDFDALGEFLSMPHVVEALGPERWGYRLVLACTCLQGFLRKLFLGLQRVRKQSAALSKTAKVD